MGWPTPQDYNEAIQNTEHCFFDPELKKGVVELNKLGLPASITGSFASVYSVSTNATRYAVRCLLNDIPDQQLRYERLSKAICSDSLEYTTDFEYQKEGIKVGDKAYPIVKMAWLAGENLDIYVEKNFSKKRKIAALRKSFLEMSRALLNEGFAHGDLQHGNIIITEDGIRLVDYDGMFVPSLTGLQSNELGHRNYQHPQREKQHFGPYLDNFSAWVIDTTLLCIETDPTLYKQWHSGNETILFELKDFNNPHESKLFEALESHESEVIRNASRRLRTIIDCLITNVPGVFDEVPLADELPRIVEKRKQAQLLAEWKLAQELEDKQREEEKQAQLEAHRKKQEEIRNAEYEKPDWLKDDENVHALNRPDAVVPQAKSKEPDVDNVPNEVESPIELNNVSVSATQTSPPVSLSSPPISLEQALQSGFYTKEIERSVELQNAFPNLIVEKEGALAKNYGKHHSVFHITYETYEYALKFFSNNIEKAINKYKLIAKLELKAQVESLLKRPEVFEQLMKFHGIPVPGISMRWVSSASRLDDFLRNNKPDFDYSLLTNFRKALRVLRINGMAHGSLEPSNILVQNDYQISFVDYDNLYFDNYCEFSEQDKASDEFMHPRFEASDYGPSVDNFNAWVLDTTMMCWSADRRLWHQYMDSNGGLFFAAADFTNPKASKLMQALLNNQVYDFSQRGKLLLNFLKLAAKDVPTLTVDGFPPEGYV